VSINVPHTGLQLLRGPYGGLCAQEHRRGEKKRGKDEEGSSPKFFNLHTKTGARLIATSQSIPEITRDPSPLRQNHQTVPGHLRPGL
jgi:hypothetical protein